MKKLITLLILCCGFISAPLLSNESCVTLLKKNQPTSCKAIGWYTNLNSPGTRCFYKCGSQDYTSSDYDSSSTKVFVRGSAGKETCNIPEEVITEEMIDLLKVMAIGEDITPIFRTMKIFKEKFQVEIIIMPQN